MTKKRVVSAIAALAIGGAASYVIRWLGQLDKEY